MSRAQAAPPIAGMTGERPVVHTASAVKGVRRVLGLAGIGAATIFALAFALLPIFWAIVTAFKLPVDVNAMPPKWIFTPTLANFEIVIGEWQLSHFFRSSLIVATLAAVLSLVIGTPAAYALLRFPFRYKQTLVLEILSVRMVPPIVAVIPIFVISQALGLYDTYTILILMYVAFNLPFVIWVMRAYLADIPIELEDAALVDGATRLQAFLRVVLPLARPGIATCLILVFVFCWNEFLFANILVSGEHRTVPTVVASAIKQRAVLWGPASAAALLAIVPIVILALLVRRHIVRGLTLGALK